VLAGEDLFRQAQGGCHASLNALMERHEGLVRAVVRRQVLGDLPYREALQAGRVGLWRAILRFDPERGYAFSTYAWPCIVHHVWRAVKVHTRASETEHVPSYAQWHTQWQSISRTDPETIAAARAAHDALHALVRRLPERLQSIIVARYGLHGQRGCLYRQVGQLLGLSGERVRQLHSEALVWLRHPARTQHLRSLLGRHTVADYVWAEAQAQRWLRRRGGRHGRS
jgi:RNA polymerase sigma factor (sigma-70 family)